VFDEDGDSNGMSHDLGVRVTYVTTGMSDV
jgi:hypothetical protein